MPNPPPVSPATLPHTQPMVSSSNQPTNSPKTPQIISPTSQPATTQVISSTTQPMVSPTYQPIVSHTQQMVSPNTQQIISPTSPLVTTQVIPQHVTSQVISPQPVTTQIISPTSISQQEPPHQPMIFPITQQDVSQQVPPPPTTQAYLDLTLPPCTTHSNYGFSLSMSVREGLLPANPPMTTDPNIRQFSNEYSFYSPYPGSQQSIDSMWTFADDDFMECDCSVQRSSTPTPTRHQNLHVPSLKISGFHQQNVPSPQVYYTHDIIMYHSLHVKSLLFSSCGNTSKCWRNRLLDCRVHYLRKKSG